MGLCYKDNSEHRNFFLKVSLCDDQLCHMVMKADVSLNVILKLMNWLPVLQGQIQSKKGGEAKVTSIVTFSLEKECKTNQNVPPLPPTHPYSLLKGGCWSRASTKPCVDNVLVAEIKLKLNITAVQFGMDPNQPEFRNHRTSNMWQHCFVECS